MFLPIKLLVFLSVKFSYLFYIILGGWSPQLQGQDHSWKSLHSPCSLWPQHFFYPFFSSRALLSIRQHSHFNIYILSSGCYKKYHRLDDLTTDIYFSQFWRLENLRSRLQQIWFLVRILFLACRWPPSCWMLTHMVFPQSVHVEREKSFIIISSSYKNSIPIMRTPPS